MHVKFDVMDRLILLKLAFYQSTLRELLYAK